MKKILSLLISLMLLMSMCTAFAENISLTGYDADGNETEIEVPENCRLILLDIWQPWCSPCRECIPHLTRLYEKFAYEGLLVVGAFSYTDVNGYTLGMSAWEMAEKAGVNYPIVRIDDDQVSELVGFFPSLMFLDAEWNIIPLSDEMKLELTMEDYRLRLEKIIESSELTAEEYDQIAELLEDEDYLREIAMGTLEETKCGKTADQGLAGSYSEAVLEVAIENLLENTGKSVVETENTATAEETAENIVIGYRVIVTDESGNPVPGVTIQICPGDRCVMHKSNEEGQAIFEDVEPGIWEFHLLKIPTGYKLVSEIPEKTSPNDRYIYIVLGRTD